jgi:hypothetical protein
MKSKNFTETRLVVETLTVFPKNITTNKAIQI